MDDPIITNEHHPWECFKHWIKAICVVNFDLELGQTIEVIYPGDAHLSAVEKSNICYLAFPDSNSSCTGDTDYFFRLRRPEEDQALTDIQWQFSNEVPASMQPDPRFYFGFVHFRQMRDPTLPRGYFQKSLVLLTPLPLFGLFSHVIESISYGFFESGETAIEAACQHIDRWPLPRPGENLQLHLLGANIQGRIPSRSDVPQKPISLDFPHISLFPQSVVLPVLHEVNFYESLKLALNHIHTLWELVIIGEPLVVMAPTPALCSHIVQSLVSIIWPLKFCSDYRPFFTIHDSDFGEITSRHARPNMMIGVTNPFFSKTLQHWPHILRVVDTDANSQATIAEKLFKKNWDGKPGFYSQHKPLLHPGNSLKKKLLKVGKRPDTVQNAILRRHFLELTHSFIIPLERCDLDRIRIVFRYIATLLPLKKQITPFKSLPQIKPFVLEDFLSSLEQAGPVLTSSVKGDWTGLYRKFFKSTNFNGWLKQRLNNINDQLKLAHLEVLCTADLTQESLSTRKEVEIVDLVLKIRDKIMDLDGRHPEKRSKLQKQLNKVLTSVDEELKSVLLSNCQLREAFEI